MSMLGSSLLGVFGYAPLLDGFDSVFNDVINEQKEYWPNLFNDIKDIVTTSADTGTDLLRGLSNGQDVFSNYWFHQNRTFTTDQVRTWKPGSATAREWLSRASLSGSTIQLANDPYQDASWFFVVFNTPNGFSPLNYNPETKEWCWIETYEFRNNPFSDFIDTLRPKIGNERADSLETLLDMSPVNAAFVALFAPIAILESEARKIKEHYGEEIDPITNLDAYRPVNVKICLSLCDLKSANRQLYDTLVNSHGYDPCIDDDIEEKLNLCQ